jgi:hypothetical protein
MLALVRGIEMTGGRNADTNPAIVQPKDRVRRYRNI